MEQEPEKTMALTRVFRNPQDLNQALVSQRDKAHLMTPYARTEFGVIARGFVPSVRSTMIDADPEHGEVYKSWERPGELALTKVGLTKLGQLGGVVWVASVRTDDRKDPYLAEFHAEGKIQDIDGTWHNAQATRTINLNDGSPEAEKMKPNELKKARQNIAALAESKAKNRVLRELFGIAQSYKPEELNKPFVVLKLAPDMEDPEVRRLVQAQQLGLEKMLFPSLPAPEEPSVPVLPSGTTGLDIPEVPGDKPAPPGGPGPVIDVKAEEHHETAAKPDRPKKLKLVTDLYYTRTQAGIRDPGKPPLADLSDDQLDKIIEVLQDKPAIRKTAEEELI